MDEHPVHENKRPLFLTTIADIMGQYPWGQRQRKEGERDGGKGNVEKHGGCDRMTN